MRAPAPLLGAAIHFILLVVPQLGLHAHLGSSWLNAAIVGGEKRCCLVPCVQYAVQATQASWQEH